MVLQEAEHVRPLTRSLGRLEAELDFEEERMSGRTTQAHHPDKELLIATEDATDAVIKLHQYRG